MQKIMFNDRYGLTDAVIDYIKNNTRRIEGGEQFQRAATSAEDFTYEEATGCIVMCCQGMKFFAINAAARSARSWPWRKVITMRFRQDVTFLYMARIEHLAGETNCLCEPI